MTRPPVTEDEGFQMAPMIDMVFLLLVFFMTVSTLARSARPSLELTESSVATLAASKPRIVITLLPESNGEYDWCLGPQPVSEEDLMEALSGEYPAEKSILLRAGPETPWGEVETAQSMIRKTGHREIHYACWESL